VEAETLQVEEKHWRPKKKHEVEKGQSLKFMAAITRISVEPKRGHIIELPF